MNHPRQEEPCLRQLFRSYARGDHYYVNLRYAVGDTGKPFAHVARNELDPRSGGLQQAMRFTQRNAEAIGRRAGFEEIESGVVDIAQFVEVLEQLDDMHRPLAGAEAKFDHFSRFQTTNLAKNEAIGSGLGKMQKIE